MAYSESQIDRNNFKWFQGNNSVNSLKRLAVSNGEIRGVKPLSIEFNYPITVIVGENGAGKSTLLALACCAFHNETDFIPQNRIRVNAKKARKYYTYGDFFTFSPDEAGISEIEIKAEYLSPDGIKTDIRKKKPSGKWNDFNRRPKRAVAYLGINRIVPPSESSPHRHYSRKFQKAALQREEVLQLKDSMTAIIGRNYESIDLNGYNGYRLFEAKRNTLTYTGFNMGAGENAVLGLLLEIINAGPGALIIVDEIELGLHVQAQRRLIEELKRLCDKYHCQIICSSHSKEILDCLPPEGRIFLRRTDTTIDVIPKVSSEYAFGQLAGEGSSELTVFVEDEVGELFLNALLPLEDVRQRIRIISVGSFESVLRHMAVHYREGDTNFVSFFDGDQSGKTNEFIGKIKKYLETRYTEGEMEFESLLQERIDYLPGNFWPERVIIESALKSQNLERLKNDWGCGTIDIVHRYLEEALTERKHNEFFAIGKNLHLNEEQVRMDLMRLYRYDNINEYERITNHIRQLMPK